MSGTTQIGWQIINEEGFNIHGDEDDPFELNSFAILTGKAAESAELWVAENDGYEMAPVFEGDIEEPEFISHMIIPVAERGFPGA